MLSTGSLSQSLLNDVMTHLSSALKVNYGLKVLNLSKLGLTDFIMVNMLSPAIYENKNLETLNLSCNRITRDGGVSLGVALAYHPSINFLKLSCCAIQDQGAHAIAKLLETNTKLKEYVKLTRIYLDYNKITGDGLIALANVLTRNVMIRYIAVYGNQWDQPSCQVSIIN
jgi:Ran GTPase-activating protein (RanGAP) involved in mRNA processing and transport